MTPISPQNVRPSQKSVEDQQNRRVTTDLATRLQRIGVNLSQFKWTLDHVFSNPTGFYFYCGEYAPLIDAAEKTRKMELNFEGLPGHDLWATQMVQHIGYVELNSPEPVGLDFAVNRPGHCRAYYVPQSMKKRGEAYRQLQVQAANEKEVYREIARRLANSHPPIPLDDHVAKIQRIGTTTLDGVNFFARDYKKLKQVLIAARDSSGAPFFAHAILDNDDHWALKLSFLATDGTGFREVSRMKFSDRPLLASGARDRRDFRNSRPLRGRLYRRVSGTAEPARSLVATLCRVLPWMQYSRPGWCRYSSVAPLPASPSNCLAHRLPRDANRCPERAQRRQPTRSPLRRYQPRHLSSPPHHRDLLIGQYFVQKGLEPPARLGNTDGLHPPASCTGELYTSVAGRARSHRTPWPRFFSAPGCACRPTRILPGHPQNERRDLRRDPGDGRPLRRAPTSPRRPQARPPS
jgi:hypothetical protein